MAEIRLYLDEDAMRRSLVFSLRARGVDLLTAFEAGMVNRSDHDHLERASAESRVLFSYNTADYCRLHYAWIAEGRTNAGIIVGAQQRHTTSDEAARLLRLISRLRPFEMENRIEFLSSWSTRPT